MTDVVSIDGSSEPGDTKGHEHAFVRQFSNPSTCRHFRCRRRDSNPRHADYDSAPSDHEELKGLQITAFISRGNTAEYPVSGYFRAYSG